MKKQALAVHTLPSYQIIKEKRLKQNLWDSNEKSLVAQWLNCFTAAKTVLMTWGSVLGSQFKVDSAFYPFEVGKMSTQLTGGEGGQCEACIINV